MAVVLLVVLLVLLVVVLLLLVVVLLLVMLLVLLLVLLLVHMLLPQCPCYFLLLRHDRSLSLPLLRRSRLSHSLLNASSYFHPPLLQCVCIPPLQLTPSLLVLLAHLMSSYPHLLLHLPQVRDSPIDILVEMCPLFHAP
jgi:hypothetical protein